MLFGGVDGIVVVFNWSFGEFVFILFGYSKCVRFKLVIGCFLCVWFVNLYLEGVFYVDCFYVNMFNVLLWCFFKCIVWCIY